MSNVVVVPSHTAGKTEIENVSVLSSLFVIVAVICCEPPLVRVACAASRDRLTSPYASADVAVRRKIRKAAMISEETFII